MRAMNSRCLSEIINVFKAVSAVLLLKTRRISAKLFNRKTCTRNAASGRSKREGFSGGREAIGESLPF